MAACPRPPSNMASATTAFGALRALPSSGNPAEDDHTEHNLAKPGTRGGKSSNRRGEQRPKQVHAARPRACDLDGILHLRRGESGAAGHGGHPGRLAGSGKLDPDDLPLGTGVRRAAVDRMAGHIGYLRYIIGSATIFAVASVGC